MILERFEVPGLSHYSYVLGSQGESVVIDPKRLGRPDLLGSRRHASKPMPL